MTRLMSGSHPTYVGRFAPSPTGPLHFGSLIAALASYLDARAHRGTWLVRIEDVDETRCDPVYAPQILDTLQGFGLRWDGDVVIQSQRQQRYDEALAALSAAGHLYACECSRREMADSAVAGIGGLIYPGTCRHKGLALTGSASPSATRFAVAAAPVVFRDRLQGMVLQRLDTEVGDFVVRRRDRLTAYQLAVVIDDADAGVTDVVRGADLLDSTARQIALQRVLGLPTPRYLHIPVATNAAGEKLSKQTLATPVSTTDAAATLCEALRFLGQPITPTMGSVESMLTRAVAAWEIANIPAVRSLQWVAVSRA